MGGSRRSRSRSKSRRRHSSSSQSDSDGDRRRRHRRQEDRRRRSRRRSYSSGSGSESASDRDQFGRDRQERRNYDKEDIGRDRKERRRYEKEAEEERKERLLALANSTGPSKEDLVRWREEYRQGEYLAIKSNDRRKYSIAGKNSKIVDSICSQENGVLLQFFSNYLLLKGAMIFFGNVRKILTLNTGRTWWRSE